MVVDGVQENDSRIQNEEHFHTATAKRSVLVNADGSLVSATQPLPVDIALTETINATVSGTVSATILGGTVTATVSGTVSATILNTVTSTFGSVVASVSNFPSGFTNTITGTVHLTGTTGNYVTLVDSSGVTINSISHSSGRNYLAVDHDDISVSGTMSGTGGAVTVDTHNAGTAIVLCTGTWKGKIDIQGTIDSTWVSLSIVQPTGQLVRSGIQNDNQNGSYRVAIVSGYSQLRAVFTEYTSGTASIKINVSNPVGSNFVFQLNGSNMHTYVDNGFITLTGTNNVIATISGTPSVSLSGTNNKVLLINASGTVIETYDDLEGEPNLGVAMKQAVYVDDNNTSTSNLGPLASFTGTAQTTLGVAGLQVNLKTDQNCLVSVQQGVSTTQWDQIDNYQYYYSKGGASWTTQAVNAYYRVVVTNQNLTTTTTYFRLSSALCPVVEAVPRALDVDGYFQTTVNKVQGKMGKVRISPMGGFKTFSSCRLAGAIFTGTTQDTNYWVTTTANNGSSSQSNGEINVLTNTTANGSALVQTVRVARYLSSNPNYARCNVNCPTVLTTTGNNVRRWGAYDASDGYFFQLTQTQGQTIPVLGVVARKNTADTEVLNGSFTGDLGNTYLVDTGCHTYEIWWTNKSAYFFIDDVHLHTITGNYATSVGTPHLKFSMENINSSSNAASNNLVCRNASIVRAGSFTSQPVFNYTTGTVATGKQLKFGPGNIHTLVISEVQTTGAIVTLYDGTSTSTGSIIWNSGPMTKSIPQPNVDLKGAPFSTGLMLQISAQNATVTCVYE